MPEETEVFKELRKEIILREIPCLEQGRPYSETIYVMAYGMKEAIEKAQKGEGRRLTKEELEQLWGEGLYND